MPRSDRQGVLDGDDIAILMSAFTSDDVDFEVVAHLGDLDGDVPVEDTNGRQVNGVLGVRSGMFNSARDVRAFPNRHRVDFFSLRNGVWQEAVTQTSVRQCQEAQVQRPPQQRRR